MESTGGKMYKEKIEQIFMSPPTVETERLILRRIVSSDCDDIYEYSSKDEVTKYLSWEKHTDKKFTKRYMKIINKAYKEGRYFDWAVELKSGGKMIGTCGFSGFDYQNNTCEIGYVINPDFWGNSYAAEAANAVIRFAFDVLGAHAVRAKCFLENTASCEVMKKCGMSFLCEKNEYVNKFRKNVDLIYYGITRSEYYTHNKTE